MHRFVETLKVYAGKERRFTMRVDGTEDNFKYSQAMGYLGYVAPEVREILYRYHSKHWSSEPSSIIAAAYLVETHGELQYNYQITVQ
ncbi:MAG: hypothetical protein ACL93V_01675 [Candidatus Electrothrix sp. YB6]